MRFKFIALIVLAFFIFPSLIFAHAEESENKVIHITSDGFSPSNLKINLGESIVFENTDANDHWPAGNDHPSHTLYDGSSLEEHCTGGSNESFDACKALKPGDSWSFKFVKTGEFKFHDHLWPQLTGTITVDDSTLINQKDVRVGFLERLINWFKSLIIKIYYIFGRVPDKNNALEKGETQNAKYVQLKAKYEELVRDSDPGKTITTLEADSQKDNYVLSVCHDLLHDIGKVSFEKYYSFEEAIKYQNDFCNSGYVHGIFAEYFMQKGDDLPVVNDLCTEYANGKNFDMWQCSHGVGHGLMYLTGGDLPKSLTLCGEIFPESNVNTCINGVYMELFNSEVLAKETEFVSKADPFMTCHDATIGKGDCYLYLPTYLSQTVKIDFKDMFSMCDKSEPRYRDICINGIGSEVMKRNMNEKKSVIDFCEGTQNLQDSKSCISGAASVYVFQKASYDEGLNFCKEAPPKYLISCTDSLRGLRSFF